MTVSVTLDLPPSVFAHPRYGPSVIDGCELANVFEHLAGSVAARELRAGDKVVCYTRKPNGESLKLGFLTVNAN